MTCNIDYIVFLELSFMRSEIIEIILQVLLVENVSIYYVAAMEGPKPVKQRLCIETELIIAFVLQSLHCLIPLYVSGATSKFDIAPLSVCVRLLGQVTSLEQLFCSLQCILSLSHVVLCILPLTFSCSFQFVE